MSKKIPDDKLELWEQIIKMDLDRSDDTPATRERKTLTLRLLEEVRELRGRVKHLEKELDAAEHRNLELTSGKPEDVNVWYQRGYSAALKTHGDGR